MPGGDRTGPTGKGPMTGRGAGYCVGNAAPGFGGGFGRGFGGRGRGRCNWLGRPTPVANAPFASNYSREQEVSDLKAQADYFGNALEEVKKRIKDLETK